MLSWMSHRVYLHQVLPVMPLTFCHFKQAEQICDEVTLAVSNSTASKRKLLPDDHRYSDCHNHAPTKVHFSARF